ncbi:MAG: glycerate kinase [Oscillospiraceae bacterium]|nr:glycerate kinase [Oscillospiraceae bacterium]
MNLYADAQTILREAIAVVQPEAAVTRALAQLPPCHGRRILVAVGKAACPMASAALQALDGHVHAGIVITKHGHGVPLPAPLQVLEAGHPVPDAATYAATDQALALTENLTPVDQVLFLLSGGGSALFEQPLLPPQELADVTQQLLACGAAITQVNTIRKRLSAVKGGRFALHCAPAQVWSVVLSDVLGDRLDMIASGPACPDRSTAEEALEIVNRYALRLSPQALACLRRPTPSALPNAQSIVTGSVRQLVDAAARTCRRLGYDVEILTDCLQSEARDAGRWLAREALLRSGPRALLAGGETVVHVMGPGLGGRNQELALSAAAQIAGQRALAIFSFGSDGTDGPTDAAGGYVDGQTQAALARQGISIPDVLARNDAYHALEACGGLIKTGPTGTNVNDLSVALLGPERQGNY